MEVGMDCKINEYGKPVWSGVEMESEFSALEFYEVDMKWSETDQQWALHTNLGTISVLDRMTGFGWRDIETGFRAKDGKFWLASGGFDVREHDPKTFGEAVELIKSNANNCVGE